MKYIYLALDSNHEYLIPVSMLKIARHHSLIELEDLSDNRYTLKYLSDDIAKKEYESIIKWIDGTRRLYEADKPIYKINANECEELIGW